MRETGHDADGTENMAAEILLFGSQGWQKAFVDSCVFFTSSGSEIALMCCKNGCHAQHMYCTPVF